MLVKTVLVFLLAMLLVGMVGKAIYSGTRKRLGRRPAVCGRCGRPLIGRGGCDCGGRK